jgi:CDP-diacylglycerol pyrophosphatase
MRIPFVLHRKMLLVILLLIAALTASLPFLFKWFNSDALWKIISRQCFPSQIASQRPTPCAKVDQTAGYVILKDKVGPLQYLLMPIDRITGIEDPVVLYPDTPNFFALAWQQRHVMSDKLGKPIADDDIALAVNSKYGRTQNQLHIHVSCIRSDVRNSLSGLRPTPAEHWSHLPGGLLGHDYLVRRTGESELQQRGAFQLLADEVDGAGGNMADFGLAMTALPDGGLLLLATEFDPLRLNFASPEELQDHNCGVLASR